MLVKPLVEKFLIIWEDSLDVFSQGASPKRSNAVLAASVQGDGALDLGLLTVP